MKHGNAGCVRSFQGYRPGVAPWLVRTLRKIPGSEMMPPGGKQQDPKNRGILRRKTDTKKNRDTKTN